MTLAGCDTVFDPNAATHPGDQDGTGLPATIGGVRYRVLCAEGMDPRTLRRQVAALQVLGTPVALAARSRIDAALDDHCQAVRIDRAVNDLLRRQPVDCAGGAVLVPWQRAAAAAAAAMLAGGATVSLDATIFALTALAALPFLCVVLMRAVALREVVRSRAWRACAEPPACAMGQEAPIYSVLVPLYREAAVLPGLLQSLQELDYPRAKLEVLLVLEASDLDTQAALRALPLPYGFRTMLVPEAGPRTKPKALNYALQAARGEYVVVYDAEDRPQPDQLRRALEMFRRGPPELGCVQAQLNVYNPLDSWFTRQFTVEYSALFDALLPALAHLGLPVPLGGTSNHFRRETLVAAGGWDPYTVTEDADLGFRLARRGWLTAVLASTTWEEAPVSFGRWFRQRTRWLKGWMQTYLVHTRRPWQLGRDLGVRGALGFHVLMGGLVLMALLHPLSYALLAYQVASGQLLGPVPSPAGTALWALAWLNLAAGYLSAILVGAVSAWRRGHPGLVRSALMMPLCWLLVSAAAYRALCQLATDPYLWEKTEHGSG
jgi:glycosyltransferase involved in cell wall biosynthesis